MVRVRQRIDHEKVAMVIEYIVLWYNGNIEYCYSFGRKSFVCRTQSMPATL